MTQKGHIRILIVAFLIVLLGGYLIYQKQSHLSQNEEKPYNGPSEKIIVLKPSDECKENTNLCNLLSKVNQNMNQSNYSSLLDLQKKMENECITGSLPASVCEGAKEGEKRSGYVIGGQDSEFDIASGNKYITRISEFVKSNTPLNYEETVIATNRASVSYINQSTQMFLIFNLLQIEDGWKIKDTLLGKNHKAYLKNFYPTFK